MQFFSRFIIWWVTLAGAIVICMYGVEESDMLVKELDGVSSVTYKTFLSFYSILGISQS